MPMMTPPAVSFFAPALGRRFFMTAVRGGHPSGRRGATLKIAPGNF
ncbi:hypothetical protein BN2364_1295 [Alloalcanivorax xenomutans]|nr:hypothetical protein BN2364_1295 [Alloalcanivorax xenomutans]